MLETQILQKSAGESASYDYGVGSGSEILLTPKYAWRASLATASVAKRHLQKCSVLHLCLPFLIHLLLACWLVGQNSRSSAPIGHLISLSSSRYVLGSLE